MLHRLASRSLAACGLLVLATASCDSGGSATASGGTRPALAADWAMRSDLQVASDVLADVRAGDVDGDGLADLVHASSVAREFVVSLGLPDGTFAPTAVLPASGIPWRSELGDLDGDGRVDVAALSFAGPGGAEPSLQVFLQDATGAFGAPIVHVFLEDPDDLALAPSDGVAGSGAPDELFVAINREKRVARLALSGAALVETGSLDSSVLGHPGAAFSVAIWDEHADGSLDLAVAEAQIAGSELGRVLVYPRAGGAFGDPRVLFEPVYWPTVDAVGDVDGDGTPDLGVAQVDNDEALLVLGDPTGEPTIVPVVFGPGATSLVFADLDQDGDVDGVAAAFEQAALYVRLADGPLAFGPPTLYDAGFLPRALGLLRLPGDAVPDLVSANLHTIGLLRGRGDGSFAGARGSVLSAGEPRVLRVADLDGDGDLDACVLCTAEPAVLLVENLGGGRFEEVHAWPLEADAEPTDLAFADAEGDGFPDPVVTLAGLDRVRVLRNGGPGALGSDAYDVAVGSVPRGIAAGQLDGAGAEELVVALGGDQAVLRLAFDSGAGRYVPQGTDAIGAAADGLRLGDLDGDLDLDLLVTVAPLPGASVPPPGPTELRACEWDGAAFVPRQTVPLDAPAGSLDLGDVDGDGDLDAVVAQLAQGQSELFLLTNESGGGGLSFAAERLLVGVVPSTVLLRDVDGDQRLDVLVPSANGELRLLMGNGRGDFPTLLPERAGQLSLLVDTIGAISAEVDGDVRGLEDLLYVSPNAPVLWMASNESIDL